MGYQALTFLFFVWTILDYHNFWLFRGQVSIFLEFCKIWSRYHILQNWDFCFEERVVSSDHKGQFDWLLICYSQYKVINYVKTCKFQWLNSEYFYDELKMIYLFLEAHETVICSRNKQFLMSSHEDLLFNVLEWNIQIKGQ